MSLVEEIAAEVADRLQFALERAGNVDAPKIRQLLQHGTSVRALCEELLRPSFGDDPVQALVRKIIVEAERIKPQVTRRHMLATSREMRKTACG